MNLANYDFYSITLMGKISSLSLATLLHISLEIRHETQGGLGPGIEGIVSLLRKYTYMFSCSELEDKIHTTLMSSH